MPAHFIPARNSRHRTACFALYRALLRLVPNVDLPNDLQPAEGRPNPIQHLIRKGFRRNKGDTSLRLVFSSLSNGYRFLELLTRAHTPFSADYNSVIAYLRARAAHIASLPPRPPPPSTAPNPGNIPLLTRVSNLSDPPVYKPTVRPLPLDRLSGERRRVPKLVAESNGIPFLRLSKPQSRVLERVVRQKAQKRGQRAMLLSKLEDEEVPFAELEDAWEAILAQRLREEGVLGRLEAKRMGTPPLGETYAGSVKVTIDYLSEKQNEEKEDMTARARAMMGLVEDEAALAKKEKEQKRAKRYEAWVKRMREEGHDTTAISSTEDTTRSAS